MSDIFHMLQNAPIFNEDDELVGQAVGFEVLNGRMKIRMVAFDEDEDEEDGDDPEKEDIPEPTIKEKIRAIAGGKESIGRV